MPASFSVLELLQGKALFKLLKSAFDVGWL
jgi:hypothetical protein